jgi:hypothetical protein
MTDQANLKRRHFLLTAGVGGVTAAAAVVAVRSGDASAEATAPRRDGQAGLPHDRAHRQLLPHRAGLTGGDRT